MVFATHDSNHEPDDRRLHLSDLPRWPVWVLLLIASLASMGLLAVIEDFMDGPTRSIAASALMRGVPPPSH